MGLVRSSRAQRCDPTQHHWPQWYPARDMAPLVHLLALMITFFPLFRMPVQYILGEWDFQGLNLKMAPPVFIPRPETEVGVPAGLDRMG